MANKFYFYWFQFFTLRSDSCFVANIFGTLPLRHLLIWCFTSIFSCLFWRLKSEIWHLILAIYFISVKIWEEFFLNLGQKLWKLSGWNFYGSKPTPGNKISFYRHYQLRTATVFTNNKSKTLFLPSSSVTESC
jgi:hypothetical protein